VTSREETLKP